MKINPASNSYLGKETKKWNQIKAQQIMAEEIKLGNIKISLDDNNNMVVGNKKIIGISHTCITGTILNPAAMVYSNVFLNIASCFPAEEIIIDWGDGDPETFAVINEELDLEIGPEIDQNIINISSFSTSVSLDSVPEGYTVPFTWSITTNNSDPVTDIEMEML